MFRQISSSGARQAGERSPVSGVAGLFERDHQVTAVAALAARALAGEGAVISIAGRPGEGKTALLEAACALAAERGLRVCRARGSELEREHAFAVVRQLLEGELRRLDAVTRRELFDGAAGLAAGIFDLDSGRTAGSTFAALHGLHWTLADLCAQHPLLLAIDDAHWADEVSTQWLAYLNGRVADLPALVVVAHRSGDPGAAAVEALRADRTVTALSVGPLGRESIAALAARRFGRRTSAGFLDACRSVTGGNPFALTELLDELRRLDADPDAETEDTLVRLAPAGLARNVAARLRALGEQNAELARLLAVLGDGAPLRLAASMAGVDLDRAADAVDELVGVGLLASARELRFAHPLLRAAVYESMSERRRARRHALAAELLARERADPQVVAAHLLRADPAGEPVNVERLRAAATAALARGAPRQAVVYLRRALAEPPQGAQRRLLLAELGAAETLVRDRAAASHLREALAEADDRGDRVHLELALADVHLYAGEPDEAFAALARAAQEAEPELAAAVERQRTTMAMAVELSGTRMPTERLRELADDDTPAARALRVILATRLARRCAPKDEVLPLIASAVDDGRLLAREGDAAGELIHAAVMLISYDELERARWLAGELMADAARRGSMLGYVHGAMLRSLAHLRAGELAAGEADARDAVQIAGELPLEFVQPFVASYLAALLRERGHPREAGALLESQLEHATLNGRVTVLETRARIRQELGERDGAIADLRAVGAMLGAAGIAHPAFNRWRSQLAVALGPGEPEALALALDELADARRAGVASATGVALAAVARVQASERREATFDEAIERLRAGPARLELAKALAGAGAELRRAGRRTQAREPLREALDLALRCGADALAEHATEELRAADGRPRRRWSSGVNALTPSELRVASRAAEGLSNRAIAQALFVTTKTVEMHLSNAYRKLGIGSRAELPGALAGDS